MKIDRPGKPVTTGNAGRAAPRTAIARPDAPETPAATDQVQLSGSTQVKALEQRLADTPVVDAARVEAIKQALAEGRYTIRPEAIADGLIKSVKDMLKG